MKTFSCRDTGMDCDWKCRASDEEEILSQVQAHAQKAHGIDNFDDEALQRIRSKIQDVQVA